MNIKIPLFAALALAVFNPSSVLACSTCMVGDPTLTLMGVEKPFEGRLRTSFDYVTRTEKLGKEGVNRKKIDEDRYILSFAYAPNRRWMLGLSIPWVKRKLDSFNLVEEKVDALGDVQLDIKSFLQSEEVSRNNQYGLLGGIRFPTADEQSDNGEKLDFDVQPGTGATAVKLGAWYSHFAFPYLFYVSSFYQVQVEEGFQGFDAGDSVVLNSGVQYATNYDLAFQLGFEGRWSDTDSFDDTGDDPDSGGTIGYLAPGLVYTPRTDLLLNATIKLPVIEELDGDHKESTIYSIGVVYDFDIH